MFCHNDLHAGNLLAEIANGNVRLTGVLDFEGALAGDPLMDVAKAIYYLPEQTRRAVIEGYGDMGSRPWRANPRPLLALISCSRIWCWIAQFGNAGANDKLALDLERASRSQEVIIPGQPRRAEPQIHPPLSCVQ